MTWKLISKKTDYSNPWFKVERSTFDVGKKNEDWFTVDSPFNAVIVFAVTKEKKVVLTRQYRVGVGRKVLELPAGFIDEGESPEKAVERELMEETGFKVEKIEKLGELLIRSSRSKDVDFVYYAELGEKGERTLQGSEDIELVFLSVEETFEKARNGEIEGSSYVATVLLAKEKKFK